MKIFIVGLPKSGRTMVAKAICEAENYNYMDATSWVKSDFRQPKEGELPHQFEDEYHQYLTKRMNINPNFIRDHLCEMMKMIESTEHHFVIDGVFSPPDFINLFDYREDVVVFLNRIDNDHDCQDHENIGNSVIRDYCFWMSSAGVIARKRWLEYNFRIQGEDSDAIKTMGVQNSVFIVKSINKVMSHLNEQIKEITNAIPR